MLLLVAAACSAASAWAATITGTSASEILRGTAGADTIYGGGGNDRLYGLGGDDYLNGGAGDDYLSGGRGNDTLVGGPGADTIVCGPGRDTVVTDGADKIASDCEVIRRAPPAKVNVLAGRYCGFTSQGMSICFTVTPRRRFAQARFAVRIDCTPSSTQEQTVEMPDAVPIRADGSFDYRVRNASQVATAVFNGVVGTYLRGRIDATGNAHGHVHMSTLSFAESETRYSCETADASWRAKLQR